MHNNRHRPETCIALAVNRDIADHVEDDGQLIARKQHVGRYARHPATDESTSMICAEAFNGQEVVVHVGRDLRRDNNIELVQSKVRLFVDVHCRTHTLAAAGLDIPKYCELAAALIFVCEVIAGA